MIVYFNIYSVDIIINAPEQKQDTPGFVKLFCQVWRYRYLVIY